MGGVPGEKNIFMSIKVREEDLEMYEFVRITALIEATKVIKKTGQESCLEC